MASEKDVIKRHGSNSGFQEGNETRTHDLPENNRLPRDAHVSHTTPERILTAQHDLGFLLANSASIKDVLRLCLDTALRISGLDSGGIYAVDSTTGALRLACAEGISDRFYRQIDSLSIDNDRVQKFVSDRPAYLDHAAMDAPDLQDAMAEGITATGIIPIRTEEQLIGLMIIASRCLERIPPDSRSALESIAPLIGCAILRARDVAALQASEKRYRDLFENAVEGIYQAGLDGRLLNVNPALARMTGYDSPQKMISAIKNPDEQIIVSPEDKGRLEKLFAETGAVHEYELQIYRKDRSIMWASINIRPVHDEHGVIIHYEGAVQDVTWRKSAEQALRESEGKYRSVVESSLAAFYIAQDYLMRYVNRQLCVITGYSREELLDKMGPFDLVHPDDHAKVRENLERHFADPSKERQYTFRVVRKDGRVIDMRIFGSSMEYNGRYAICGTAIDITNELAMEAQLRQTQKMESIGTLAGGIAHDFNNILGGMMGYAEMAEMQTEEPRTRNYLEQILRACNRAKHLVNQILTFSRPEENEKIALHITPVVEEALKLIRSTLPSTVEVRLKCENARDTVLADANQIHQVLINLSTNAAHAMRERGGVLDVHLDQTDDPGELPEELPSKGPYLRMVIRDTGHGIDPSVMDKIFDPFYTTKAPGEGTGLGLSMVYGIVRNHDGAISVTSTPGEGTAFTTYLPLIDHEEDPPEQAKEELPTGRERILLVDDDELIADVGKEILTRLGYDVTVETASPEALALFRTDPDRFDLVITDKTMPNMTGDVLAAEMLELRPDLPVIMTSGFSDQMNEAETRKIGIRKFIMKPVSMDLLAQTVRKVLDEPPPSNHSE